MIFSLAALALTFRPPPLSEVALPTGVCESRAGQKRSNCGSRPPSPARKPGPSYSFMGCTFTLAPQPSDAGGNRRVAGTEKSTGEAASTRRRCVLRSVTPKRCRSMTWQTVRDCAIWSAKLRKSGYKEIVLIGHSAGGIIARQFLERYPKGGASQR